MLPVRPPLRVLIVAPRPRGPFGTPSRARIEALYDSIEAQGELVVADWLWPPTLPALTARLRDAGQPGVDALFVDASVKAGSDALAFDGDPAAVELVTPARFAAMIREASIGLVLLSLPESSAGSMRTSHEYSQALAAGGVPHVVQLTEACPVGETLHVLSAFWVALLAGHTLGEACEQAQRALGSGDGSQPPLAVYHQSADAPIVEVETATTRATGKIVRFPSPELVPLWRRLPSQPEPGGLPPEPATGFAGRGRELGLLEGSLRGSVGNGVVLVHGYEGMGKTALVAHAARWLVRTGRFQEVVYTDFTGGGNSQSALYDLGRRLVSAGFTLGDANPQLAIEESLQRTATLVIWDGLEAVLPDGDYALTSEALGKLLRMGAQIASLGSTRLCLISTNHALGDPAFSDRALALLLDVGALDEPDARALLKGVVSRHPGAVASDSDAGELVEMIGGHPLALSVLGSLVGGASSGSVSERTLAQVTASLESILPSVRSGEARLRNGAMDLALQALYLSLGENEQARLQTLGLFATGLMGPLVESLCGLKGAEWSTLYHKLWSAALAVEERVANLAVPYLRLPRALTRYLERRIPPEVRERLDGAYCGSYMGLLSWILQKDSDAAVLVRLLARTELPNLRRALGVYLRLGDLVAASDYASQLQMILDRLGMSEEREAVAARMTQVVASALPEESPWTRAAVRFALSQGERLLSLGAVGQAGPLLQSLTERMEREAGVSYGGAEKAFDHGMALSRLARCVLVTGQFDMAAGLWGQALGLFIEAGGTPEARAEHLAAQQHMGDALLAGQHPVAAQETFREALKLATDIGDRRALASLESQLGRAYAAGDSADEARSAFECALAHLEGISDATGAAGVWVQLATLAWQRGDLSEAERCLQQSLTQATVAKQPIMQAGVWAQMGRLAGQMDRIKDALECYAQATAIYKEQNASADLVLTHLTSADLLLRNGQLRGAREHAEAAREVVERPGSSGRPWDVYSLLLRIAEAEGTPQLAAEWRRHAQESFGASDEAARTVEQWNPTIQAVALACAGQALDGDTLQAIEKLEQDSAWRALAAALWRILSGERGEALFVDLDHVDAAIVRATLAAIAGPEGARSA